MIRGVLETIVSGQLLDLERFGGAGEGRVVALENDGQLEDYAWRVAGCVGEFWTELGLHTLGGKFSQAEGEELRRLGGEYGKGLQVVNILRDLPADLAMGRCYLPVADPGDEGELMAEFSRWRLRALGWLEAGFAYAGRLESRRLRAASVLPGMIGRETLLRLEGVTLEGLRGRVKVPRGRVYGMCVRAIFSEKK